MTFAAEHNLLYLWLLLPLLYLFYLGQRRLRKRLRRFASKQNLARLYRGAAWGRTRYLLLACCFVLLILALAQPRFGFEWVERTHTGRDIYVVLDVSHSMLATDITPNRLQRAKRKLADLLTLLSGDRISLIAFAGAAFVQCPLTVDYAAARLFLDHLRPELIPVRGTAIGAALQLALRSVAKSSNPEGSAIILITDGEDQGTDPLAAARQAKDAGVRIFTIGIGAAEGAPIPAADGGFVKDTQGNLVLTRLDEKTLQEIALLSGGVYVRSVSGDFDLQQIYQRGIQGSIDTQEQGSRKKKVWHEHFHLLLLAAWLLLLTELLLARQRLPLLLLLLGMFPDIGKAQGGHELFAQKKYQEAAQKFLDQEISNPDDLEAVYNRAVSQYYAGDYQRAAQGFAKAAQSPDPQLANKARFNLGNAQVAQQRLEAAQQAYEEVLQNDPQNQKAAENLAWVKEQLKKQQQQKENKDKQQQQQNENKDKQQQQQQSQQQNQQQQQAQHTEQEQQQQSQQQQQQQQAQNTEQEQQQQQAQQQTSPVQQSQTLSAEEVARLLRQLENGRIGVQPRQLQPAPKKKAQDW